MWLPYEVRGQAGVTVKNIPTRENIPPVCFRVLSYAKLYPPDGRLVCGNVTFDSVEILKYIFLYQRSFLTYLIVILDILVLLVIAFHLYFMNIVSFCTCDAHF